MRYIDKLSVRLAAALLIGFLLAAAGTHITYTCSPTVGDSGCVSFDKAVMHPGDLAGNKQHSLVHFSATLAITSVIVFVLMSAVSMAQRRVPRPGGHPSS